MAKTYLVRTPILHGGKRYEIGSGIEMEENHATPLLASGAIIDTQRAVADTNETETKNDDGENAGEGDVKPKAPVKPKAKKGSK
ncbi:MAG: hypothetical protein LBE24_10635 [Methylobacillus sp.]|nr:hypothetical protein [Methylobacillus sp.]